MPYKVRHKHTVSDLHSVELITPLMSAMFSTSKNTTQFHVHVQ